TRRMPAPSAARSAAAFATYRPSGDGALAAKLRSRGQSTVDIFPARDVTPERLSPAHTTARLSAVNLGSLTARTGNRSAEAPSACHTYTPSRPPPRTRDPSGEKRTTLIAVREPDSILSVFSSGRGNARKVLTRAPCAPEVATSRLDRLGPSATLVSAP